MDTVFAGALLFAHWLTGLGLAYREQGAQVVPYVCIGFTLTTMFLMMLDPGCEAFRHHLIAGACGIGTGVAWAGWR